MRDLERQLKRARKLTDRLRSEVRKCLIERRVTEAAGALTGEVVREVGGILDAVMFMAWRGFAAAHPGTPEPAEGVRFPAAGSDEELAKAMDDWGLGRAAAVNPKLVETVWRWQPYVSTDNLWLARLKYVELLGRPHLVPQIRVEQRPVRDGSPASYTFHPMMVRLRASRWGGGGYAQSLMPHARWATGEPGRREVWVALSLVELDVNALVFCQTAVERVGRLVEVFAENVALIGA